MKKEHLLFVFILLSTIILAQSGISVTPPRNYFTLNPGEKEKKIIQVSNLSSTDNLEFAISFNDWVYDENGSNKVVEANTLENSCSSWINVFPSNVFSLAPNEKKEIEIEMTVPDTINDTPVHTTMMYITQTNTTNGRNSAGEKIKFSLRSGVKIYQRRNIQQDLNIEFIDYKYIKEENKLVIDIDNLGNIWADGIIMNELVNQDTGKVTELKDVVFYSLPGDKRTLVIALPKDLPVGKYIATSTVDLGDANDSKVAELIFDYESD